MPEEAKIMQEEPFVPIAPFENFDEVIMRANSLPYGLASYVFTRSLATATRASEALDVGTVRVNELLLATAEMPFGGSRRRIWAFDPFIFSFSFVLLFS